MTNTKAQVGDLIRVIEVDGYSDVEYKVGDIIEISKVYPEGDMSTDEVCYEGANGELLHEHEYVIHRRVGEEDSDIMTPEQQTPPIYSAPEYPEGTTFSPNGLFPIESTDAVNHPNHYTQGKFETIEIIEHLTSKYDDGFTAHCVGTAFKYMDRAPYKHESPTECLRKAAKYLEFAIERLDAKSTQD